MAAVGKGKATFFLFRSLHLLFYSSSVFLFLSLRPSLLLFDLPQRVTVSPKVLLFACHSMSMAFIMDESKQFALLLMLSLGAI